jgi:uncharacterized protein YcaQ
VGTANLGVVPVPLSLSRAQARRIALVAQGFRDPRHSTPTMRTFARTLARTGVLQVDSVNVLQRAHYMPLFSRMGPYDTDMLTRASERHPRRMVEYWAHVQAFMPVELWPVMHHRREAFRESPRWGAWVKSNPGLAQEVLVQVRDRGASTARDLDDGRPRRKVDWGWNWSEARKALDYLYLVGDVAIARRNSQFEPVYDLVDRVLPSSVLEAPIPTAQESVKELVRRAARSHGVGTVRCLSDYYRLQLQRGEGQKAAQRAVDELVEEGELVPATIEGWRRPAYLHRDARMPRKVHARALLSPFDPVVWERERTEKIFDFHYRIEIYVPEPKRQFGYYVLPFLLGDRIVGRVDLKADRKGGVLVVKAAYAEPGAPPDTAGELAAELRDLAGWLGLDAIELHDRGDLSAALQGETRLAAG